MGGTHIFLDESKYVGAFKEGKRNGEGILTSPDGGKYGDFVMVYSMGE